MQHRTILALIGDAARCNDLVTGPQDLVIVFPDAQAVADRLWEGGEDVTVVAIDGALAEASDVRELLEILRRDWPAIAVAMIK